MLLAKIEFFTEAFNTLGKEDYNISEEESEILLFIFYGYFLLFLAEKNLLNTEIFGLDFYKNSMKKYGSLFKIDIINFVSDNFDGKIMQDMLTGDGLMLVKKYLLVDSNKNYFIDFISIFVSSSDDMKNTKKTYKNLKKILLEPKYREVLNK